jgi:uncharacterized RmlC-like cupin family protein
MSTSQTTPAPLVSILANEPRRWFLGSQAWIRVGTEQSAGSLAIVEQVIPPAAESPWHLHHTQDESFYVLDGQVTVIVGNERWTLGPGDYAFGPRKSPTASASRAPRRPGSCSSAPQGQASTGSSPRPANPPPRRAFRPPSLPMSPGSPGWPPKPATRSWVPCPSTGCEDTTPPGTGQPVASASLGGQARRSHQESLTSSPSTRP